MTKPKVKTNITLNLSNLAARQTLYFVAHRYALLSAHSRLTEPDETVNAPWASVCDMTGCSLSDAYRQWIMEVDKAWVSYRKAMEDIFGIGNVPAVPFIQWSLSSEKMVYDRKKVYQASSDYARNVVLVVMGEEKK